MNITLSTDAILQEIYAASALRYFQNSENGVCPPMLCRDQRRALRMQVKDSFAHVVLRLLPHVISCNLDNEADDVAETDDDGDIMLELELHVPATFPESAAGTLRHALEHAIAMDAMELCYVGHNDRLSRRHATLAAESIELIEQLLSASMPMVAITPRWL